jgi:hypothetical protein
MPSSTLIFANAQKGAVKVGAVVVKLVSNAALFASTVRDNHAPTPLHNKT